jgi:NitT/TauT family transport system ATP-binding protein
MSHPALEMVGTGLTYPTRRGSTQALADIDLRVEQGEFVALLGPSGCGKSTLLRLAAGLLSATEGRVQVAGRPIARPDRRTGVVFQKPNLLPWKTVRGNVLMPAQTLGLESAAAGRRADELLQLVGLSAFANGYPQELSGGMQQRAGIARMLLPDPDLLLMDEPFAALDALSREHLTLELQRIWGSQRKSVLFVTHSIPEAVFLADRVLVMSPRPGRIVQELRIDLPRPRSLDTFDNPAFVAATRQLREYFNENMVK